MVSISSDGFILRMRKSLAQNSNDWASNTQGVLTCPQGKCKHEIGIFDKNAVTIDNEKLSTLVVVREDAVAKSATTDSMLKILM